MAKAQIIHKRVEKRGRLVAVCGSGDTTSPDPAKVNCPKCKGLSK